MNKQKNYASFYAWSLLLALVLFSKITSARIENYHIGINVSATDNWLTDELKEEIWLSYIKMADGAWINYSFKDTGKLAHPLLISNSKYLSKELVAFLVGKGLENKFVLVQFSPTASVVVHKEKGQNINANFIDLPEDRLQVFQLNNLTGGACVTAAGNKIVFPPKAFRCPDNAIVQIELQEMVTRKDFIETGYTSTASGRNLVSNGMYEIAAFNGEKPVEMRTGTAATIHFHTNNFEQQHKKNSFHSFYGKQDNNIIDWVPSYHEKAIGNVPQSGFLSNTNNIQGTGKSRVKRTVTYTETMFVQLCSKIHLIDNSIANELNNCKASKKTYQKIVAKYGKLNQVKKGKLTEINSYKEYLKLNNKTPYAVLIGLNQEQKSAFEKNKKEAENEAFLREEMEGNDESAGLSEAEITAQVEAEKEQFPVTMKISQLGSINCDRFDNNQKKTDVIVRLNDYNYDKIKVYAVFTDIKSVIHGYYRPEHRGIIKFNSLPEGENVVYIAATFKGDEIKLAYLSKAIKEDDYLALSLKTYTKEQYNRVLDDLIPN